MEVYKPKMFHIIKLMVLYICSIALFGYLIYLISDNYITLIVYVLFCSIMMFGFPFTFKLYFNTEEIYMTWFLSKYLKDSYYGCRWTDIKKVEYKNKNVYLYVSQDKKIKIHNLWRNNFQLWMKINEKVNENNKECIFDQSFIELIYDIKTKANKN